MANDDFNYDKKSIFTIIYLYRYIIFTKYYREGWGEASFRGS